MDNTLDDFTEKVRWLHEVDYGDFKRKVGLYLSRLQSSMDPRAAQKSGDLFERIRQEVLFDGKGEIEPARRRTLELADRIRARLANGKA